MQNKHKGRTLIKDRKIKQNKIRPIDIIFILIKLIKLNSGKINKKYKNMIHLQIW